MGRVASAAASGTPRFQSPPRQRRPLLALLAASALSVATCLVAGGAVKAAQRAAFSVPPQLPRRLAITLGPWLAPGLVANAEDPALPPQEPVDGGVKLKRVIQEGGLEDWQEKDYQAMVDDEPRTKGYEAAIQRRLEGTDGQATVVDIGTGSFALLAVMAAKAGAKKVYAIEKNIPAAKQARETIKKAGLQDKIEVIEGDSMQIELPEKVDLMVSELIGSIATQEGVEPIIKDATKRFLKAGAKLGGGGGSCPQIIPARTQTRIAPVRYRNHRVKAGAAKRGVLSRGKPEPGTLRPLRLRGKTNDLVFLSEPQLLEDFDFCSPESTPPQIERTLTFDIPANKAEDARDFSGFAMWTRLVIDEDHAVEVRGQKVTSHWAYVVALMADDPMPIPAPGSITLNAGVDYSASPVRYSLETIVPV